MNYKIDIILPVYREEENIEHVVKGIERYVKTPHRILAVWQDPLDPTIERLNILTKKHKNLTLIRSKEGIGVVKSLKEGFKNVKAKYIAIMMSDRSDDPKDIDKMVILLDKGYDLVCASRYSTKGKRVGGPKMKGLLSYLGCMTLRILTNINTNDATNAFKVFRKELLDSIKIESVGGFELPLEMTVKAYVLGMKITEVPTVWREREKGKSKFQLIQWLPQYMKWYIYALQKPRK
jgi:dolichol-phosphate mannosyltransferase